MLETEKNVYTFISYSTKMDSFEMQAYDVTEATYELAKHLSRSKKYRRYRPLDCFDGRPDLVASDNFLTEFLFDVVKENGTVIWTSNGRNHWKLR